MKHLPAALIHVGTLLAAYTVQSVAVAVIAFVVFAIYAIYEVEDTP